MLRHNHQRHTQGLTSFSTSHHLPFSNHVTDPSKEPTQKAPLDQSTDEDLIFLEKTSLKIAQLNCFNRQAVVENILAEEMFDVLILQEPWIKPHTLRAPSHPAWHDIMTYDYIAKSYPEKARTCIYVSKRIPSWSIALLPSGSPFITAVEIRNLEARLPRIRILSVYNPPSHNTGLPALEKWLEQHSTRRIPTLMGMDANLHHTLWNPVTYKHTHSLAKELIKIQGRAGFKISSQKHIPTFYPRARGKPTTIDLTWINFELTKWNVTCKTSSNNFGSDHQLLTSEIKLAEFTPGQEHNTARVDKMDKVLFCNSVEKQLSDFPDALISTEEIDRAVNKVTDAIVHSFRKQGKVVKTNIHRHKAWWDEEKLRPFIKERN